MHAIDLVLDKYGLISSEEEIIAVVESVSKQMNEYNERELIDQALTKVKRTSQPLLKYRLIAAAGSDKLVRDEGSPVVFLMIDSLMNEKYYSTCWI